MSILWYHSRGQSQWLPLKKYNPLEEENRRKPSMKQQKYFLDDKSMRFIFSQVLEKKNLKKKQTNKIKKYEFRRFRRFGGFHRFRRFCRLVIHSSVTPKNMKNSSQNFGAQPLKIQIGQKFYLTRQIWYPINSLEEISSFPNFCVSVCLPLHRAKTKHFFFLDSVFFPTAFAKAYRILRNVSHM